MKRFTIFIFQLLCVFYSISIDLSPLAPQSSLSIIASTTTSSLAHIKRGKIDHQIIIPHSTSLEKGIKISRKLLIPSVIFYFFISSLIYILNISLNGIISKEYLFIPLIFISIFVWLISSLYLYENRLSFKNRKYLIKIFLFALPALLTITAFIFSETYIPSFGRNLLLSYSLCLASIPFFIVYLFVFLYTIKNDSTQEKKISLSREKKVSLSESLGTINLEIFDTKQGKNIFPSDSTSRLSLETTATELDNGPKQVKNLTPSDSTSRLSLETTATELDNGPKQVKNLTPSDSTSRLSLETTATELDNGPKQVKNLTPSDSTSRLSLETTATKLDNDPKQVKNLSSSDSTSPHDPETPSTTEDNDSIQESKLTPSHSTSSHDPETPSTTEDNDSIQESKLTPSNSTTSLNLELPSAILDKLSSAKPPYSHTNRKTHQLATSDNSLTKPKNSHPKKSLDQGHLSNSDSTNQQKKRRPLRRQNPIEKKQTKSIPPTTPPTDLKNKSPRRLPPTLSKRSLSLGTLLKGSENRTLQNHLPPSPLPKDPPQSQISEGSTHAPISQKSESPPLTDKKKRILISKALLKTPKNLELPISDSTSSTPPSDSKNKSPRREELPLSHRSSSTANFLAVSPPSENPMRLFLKKHASSDDLLKFHSPKKEPSKLKDVYLTSLLVYSKYEGAGFPPMNSIFSYIRILQIVENYMDSVLEALLSIEKELESTQEQSLDERTKTILESISESIDKIKSEILSLEKPCIFFGHSESLTKQRRYDEEHTFKQYLDESLIPQLKKISEKISSIPEKSLKIEKISATINEIAIRLSSEKRDKATLIRILKCELQNISDSLSWILNPSFDFKKQLKESMNEHLVSKQEQSDVILKMRRAFNTLNRNISKGHIDSKGAGRIIGRNKFYKLNPDQTFLHDLILWYLLQYFFGTIEFFIQSNEAVKDEDRFHQYPTALTPKEDSLKKIFYDRFTSSQALSEFEKCINKNEYLNFLISNSLNSKENYTRFLETIIHTFNYNLTKETASA
ncbi:hypothetical protein AB834_04540 [PVC group bacterium (ex Bugula neritina AB1)]|nr:hypothetical protein AB834_04540 [PVC group bacterium (ex Bugula neritina AB1)]